MSRDAALQAAVRSEESVTVSRRDFEFERVRTVARASGSVRVIVQLDVPNLDALTGASRAAKGPGPIVAADGQLSAAIGNVRGGELAKLAGTQHSINRTYASVPFIALTVSEQALQLLQASPAVLGINEDHLAAPTLDNTVNITGASAAWAQGFDGSGWHVAILDTGIRASHNFFAGKNIVQACFASGADGAPGAGDCPNGLSSDTTSPNAARHFPTSPSSDHGTHVSGIATGNDPGRPLYGIARGADIIAVQVFSQFFGNPCFCVLSYFSDQLAGLEYVYSLRSTHNIASSNMSLGGGLYNNQAACDADNAGVKAAIDNLRGAGIATAIASGNDGACGSISAPGCISSAVAVGATDDSDFEAGFSNFHPTLLDLYAPGVNILSSVGASDSSYDGTWSGTSMATPHVAGAWAILKQADPGADVATILSALQTTGASVAGACVPAPTQRRIQIDQALGTGGGSLIKFSQPPDTAGENIASNIVWTGALSEDARTDGAVSERAVLTESDRAAQQARIEALDIQLEDGGLLTVARGAVQRGDAGGGSAAGSATIVFDNMPGDIYYTGIGWTLSVGAPINTDWDQGDAFIPTATGTLTDIWLAAGLVLGPNELDVWVMDDAAGEPGAIIHTMHFSGQMGTFGDLNPPLHWTGVGPTIFAGTQYWLIASATGPDEWSAWNLNNTGDVGAHAQKQNLGLWSVLDDARGAFRIGIGGGGFCGDGVCDPGENSCNCPVDCPGPCVPNVVVADDFVSDGRPITSVRWWGSNIPPPPPDPKVCDAPFTCGGPLMPCGTPQPGPLQCFCDKRPDGTGVCAQDWICGTYGACPNGDIDCPAGTKCIVDNCCGQPECTNNCPPPPTGLLYASDPQLNQLGTVDPSTGTFTIIGPFTGAPGGVTEIEWSPNGSTLYGTTGGGSSSILTIDPTTGTVLSSVGHPFGALNGLEFDSGGTLLGVYIPFPGNPSDLAIVDPTTGMLTAIGPTGVSNIGGLAFDSTFTTLYGISSGGGAVPPTLYSVSTITGAATPIATVALSAEASSLEFTADGRLITAGADGNLYEIDPGSGATTYIGPLVNAGKLSGLSLDPVAPLSAAQAPPPRGSGLTGSGQVIEQTTKSSPRAMPRGQYGLNSESPSWERAAERKNSRVRTPTSNYRATRRESERVAIVTITGPGACGPGAGDCCVAHGNAGCENVACCQSVCAADPYCCEIQWDQICADEALQFCGPVGCASLACGPGQGDCCVAHANPGCQNVSCCLSVCTSNPFCCDTEWDQACADRALIVCGPAGCKAAGCLVVNGDFETGTLAGWTVTDSTGNGMWTINDGTFIPASGDGPFPPCAGNYSAITDMGGAGIRTLYQDVAVPAAASATLRWIDMIHNHAGSFVDPGQEYRVEVRNPADDSLLAIVSSTNPGDVAIQPCTARCTDISAFAGQTVRIAFAEEDNFNYFNVHLENVCITLNDSCPTGACCLVGPNCLPNQTAGDCASQGGIYQGDGSSECTNCPAIVCGSGQGDCCDAHANPGCQDVSCCLAVCGADPYCCDVEWDQTCADEALNIFCGPDGCKPAVCGDGIIGVGEECDPPDGVTCNSLCQNIVCGDGVVEGREQCDPPDGITCNAQCRTIYNPPIDGWLVSFHEPLTLGGPPSPPLALYFCDATIVTVAATPLGACDAHPVRQYDADLADCCLVHSYPDSRNGLTPGQTSAFLETACYNYDIDIQAVIGRKYVPKVDPKACDSPVTCDAPTGCTGDPSCSCFFRPDGSGACAQNNLCNAFGPPCFNGDSDCPAGTKCFLATCCGDPVCLQNCPGLSPLVSGMNHLTQRLTGRLVDGRAVEMPKSGRMASLTSGGGAVPVTHSFPSPIATGGHCVEVETGNTADGPFWGWHTTSVEHGLRPALQSVVSMSVPDWLYGPWNPLTPDCSAPNMAFELITDASDDTDCNNNGVPDACESRARRELPDGYTRAVPVGVSIVVEPDESVADYAVEDTPPLDWTVSNISDDGVFDGATGKVKWGLFFDSDPRKLRYDATPPPGETGEQCFGPGVASFDGVGQVLCGDSCIEPCTNNPADLNDDRSLTINEVTAYGAAWRRGETWPVGPNPIPIEYVTQAGYLWRSGEAYCCDFAFSPPLFWVPCDVIVIPPPEESDGAGGDDAPEKTAVGGVATTRTFSLRQYAPGEPVTVAVRAQLGADMLVYAVEDAPPDGWAVGQIGSGGAFDAINDKVKWGPFFDNQPRELTYVAIAPPGESGARTFLGTLSFDGSNLLISDGRLCSLHTVDANSDGIVGLADFQELVAATHGPGSPSGDYCMDYDGDGDTDLVDFAEFQRRFTGALQQGLETRKPEE